MNCLSTNKWIILSIAEQASNSMNLINSLTEKAQKDRELPDDQKEATIPMLQSLFDAEHALSDTCASLIDIINELDKLTPQIGVTSFNFATAGRRSKTGTEEVIEPVFD